MKRLKLLVLLIVGGWSSVVLALSSAAVASQSAVRPVARRAAVSEAFQNWRTNAAYRASCRAHGYRPSPAAPVRTRSGARISGRLQAAQADALPTKFNICESNWVTAVRNQGNHSNCWAFAAMASLESWILRDRGIATDLSENHLSVNHGFDWGFDDGGNGDMAAAYFLRWGGPLLEADDPFPNPSARVTKAPAYHVQRMIKLPVRANAADNAEIKRAVMKYGALMASYYHNDNYYSKEHFSYCYNVYDKYSNHAVAIVGWDDDFPAANFKCKVEGNGAFIVRNSWSTEWGTNGYSYVSYHDATLGIRESTYAFPSAESTCNYASVYQYDPLGYVYGLGYSQTDDYGNFVTNETAWAANVFTAVSNETIEAIGFYAQAPNTEYEVYVYSGVELSEKWDGEYEMYWYGISGTEKCTMTGTRDSAGYETLTLSTPFEVKTGEKFAVVVKVTSPGVAYPVAAEGVATDEYGSPFYSTSATASLGESFINYDGADGYWEDISDYGENCCIKAYAAASAEQKKQAELEESFPGIANVADLGNWLSEYYPGETDYRTLASAKAANQVNTVTEAYIAGLNPTNPASVFTASLAVTNDTVYVSWTPDLNEGGAYSKRVYTIWGRDSLTEGGWITPTNALNRFFKVTVEMP